MDRFDEDEFLKEEKQKKEFRKSIRTLRSSWSPLRGSSPIGRWEELTVEDFKFLHACGISSE
jgi:hypothetical protein